MNSKEGEYKGRREEAKEEGRKDEREGFMSIVC
jgi:hypothetical protein